MKKIGTRSQPNSTRVFKTKTEALILDDKISFHGAVVAVSVHNSYQSNLFEGRPPVSIAAERSVSLRERGIECHVDQHLVHITFKKQSRKPGKKKYGGFPWEIRKKDLKNFPVIFEFDENHQFLGLTILR